MRISYSRSDSFSGSFKIEGIGADFFGHFADGEEGGERSGVWGVWLAFFFLVFLLNEDLF